MRFLVTPRISLPGFIRPGARTGIETRGVVEMAPGNRLAYHGLIAEIEIEGPPR